MIHACVCVGQMVVGEDRGVGFQWRITIVVTTMADYNSGYYNGGLEWCFSYGHTKSLRHVQPWRQDKDSDSDD